MRLRMMPFALLAGGLALSASGVGAGQEQEKSPAAAAPAKAVDVRPGTIGLLLVRPGPESLAAVSAGLRDGRAGVRAAAARAALVLGAPAMAPEVARALEVETDVDAAAEEAHALAALGGAQAEKALLDAANRLRPALASPVADALARTRKRAALALLPKLRSAGLEALDPIVRMGSAGQPEAMVPSAVAAVREGDALVWRAVLAAAADMAFDMPEGVLSASLTSRFPELRQVTYEYLAERGRAPGDPLRAALQEVPERSDNAHAGAAFSYELLNRALGARPRSQDVALQRLVADGAPRALPEFTHRPKLNRLLTNAERTTISRSLGREDILDRALDSPRGALESPRPPPAGEAVMRLASGFPPGFAGDTVRASGCRSDGVAVAEIRYRPDGRPQKVSLLTAPEGAGCQDAAIALFTASVAPSWRMPDVDDTARDLVVLKFDEDYLACVDEPSPQLRVGDLVTPTRVGTRIREPRKLRNVAPVYPEAARQARVQGMVVLEATIAPSGCVRDARVLNGHPMLSGAALAAVAAWRYTPTLLNGVPVPVIMTVTANFRLQ